MWNVRRSVSLSVCLLVSDNKFQNVFLSCYTKGYKCKCDKCKCHKCKCHKCKCHKCNVTNAMWQMQCDKWNVTNEMWQMKCDKCNPSRKVEDEKFRGSRGHLHISLKGGWWWKMQNTQRKTNSTSPLDPWTVNIELVLCNTFDTTTLCI